MSTGGAAAATPSRIHLDRGATWRLSEQLYLAAKVDPLGEEVSAVNLYRQFGRLQPDWYEDQLKAVNGALTGELDLPGLARRSVLDPEWGAVPDGTTDCTAAFQGALDQVASEGGGIVFVPPVANVGSQSYRLNGTVTIPAGVVLEGAGPRSIIRARAGDVQFAFAVGFCRSGLRDLTVLGNSASPSGIGVRLTQSQFVEVTRVEVWDFEIGIDVSDGSSFSAYNRIDHCEINRSTVCGIRIHQSSNGVTIVGGRVFYTFDGANGGIAIDVQDARAVSITGVSVEAYDIGLRLAGASSGSVTGSWMEKGANGAPGTDRVDFVVDEFSESEFFEGGFSFLGNHSTDPWPLQPSDVYDVRSFGAVGDGVTADTVAVQAAIDALPEGAELRFGPGTYFVGNLLISDKTRITLRGDGATLLWLSFDSGIQLEGTCTDVTIRGLRIQGSGDVNDVHRGVYSTSGQTLTRIVVEDCVIEGCMIGVSLNADLSGSIRGCVVSRCRIDNVVGENSGQGYGIHVADGTSEAHGTLIIGNRITRAHRHSIYIARGYGCRCIGNEIDQHRTGDGTGVSLGAIMVARGGDHSIEGNLVTRANNVGLFLDSGSTGGDVLRNVSVVGNVFRGPVGVHPQLYVGEDITPDGDIQGVTIEGNTFDSGAAWNVQAIRVNWGHGVTIAGNVIRMRGVTAASYGIHLVARGESAMSATSSSRWVVRNNFVQIDDGGGGSASAGIRLVTPFVDVSSVDLRCDGNAFIVPGTAFSVSASIANPNVTVALQPITGLTFATGVAQLGYAEAATALQVSGDITCIGSSSALILGDGTASGNPQVRFQKADANNQSCMVWRASAIASGLRWLLQHDSSEGLNLQVADTSGNLLAIIPWSLRYSATNGRAEVRVGRLSFDRTTTLVNGDFALSAGFGSTATVVVAANSTEHRGQITITPNGVGIVANPTCTLTYPNGTRAAAGWTISVRNGGTDATLLTAGVHWVVTDTSTGWQIAFVGLPVQTNTIILRWQMLG